MSRLPFDPSKMAAVRAAQQAGDAKAMTVAQLAEQIGGAIKSGVPGTVKVAGEVSGFRDRTHWYFDLKDAEAVVACVAFANVAKRVSFPFKDGLAVMLSGRVDYYAKAGKISLIVEKIEPVGAGALDLKLRQLVEELRALGWMDPARKRRLPVMPRKIAVVTSRSAAALQDVIDTVRRRCPAVELVLADTRVQGEGAAAEIAQTVRRVSSVAARLGIDAVLVTRGGGSMEDLWCFNEREVAAAIVECSVPVVAAIGHETDTTIAELVADERGATPTQAAMKLTPEAAGLVRQIDALHARLRGDMRERFQFRLHEIEATGNQVENAIREQVRERGMRIAALLQRAERASPAARLARGSGRLAAAMDRLPRAVEAILTKADSRGLAVQLERAMGRSAKDRRVGLDALEARIRGVSPLAVLERGYSITTGVDGSLVRSTQAVGSGDVLRTRVADGVIVSRVDGGAENSEAAKVSPPVSPKLSKKRGGEVTGGPNLFGEF